MTIQIAESVWLNAADICSLDLLAQVSGLGRDSLLALVEAGILQPSNEDPENYCFSVDCIVIARRARRLRDDFDLDSSGVALALNLLRRINELEAQVDDLSARFNPRRRAP
ncbi:MAG TPA: chaperone modulator CbpM [Candidimonas sp.]|nr:chaperone modulator CbpM [Candidimonas sp.]